jgi:hypothetical protein
MFNTYGSQNLNPDFSQFKQIPKFGAIFTLTPGLIVSWPDFGIGKTAIIKPMPKFLEIKNVHVQKRFLQSLIKPILNFLQLVLTNEIPLVVTGKISMCSGQCISSKPLQLSIQMSVAEYQGRFSGLGLKKSFSIPINLQTPEWKLCLPFFNICPKSLLNENNLQKVAASAKNCSDNPCQNRGYYNFINIYYYVKYRENVFYKGLCEDIRNTYVCTCKSGFTGKDCETSISGMINIY